VIDLLAFLLALAICSLGAHLVGLFRMVSRRRPGAAERVHRDLVLADLRIDSEFQRARRAMNEAAGQDWRNLAG
jgi:hypothetical protein